MPQIHFILEWDSILKLVPVPFLLTLVKGITDWSIFSEQTPWSFHIIKSSNFLNKLKLSSSFPPLSLFSEFLLFLFWTVAVTYNWSTCFHSGLAPIEGSIKWSFSKYIVWSVSPFRMNTKLLNVAVPTFWAQFVSNMLLTIKPFLLLFLLPGKVFRLFSTW